MCERSRSYRSHPAKRVCKIYLVQIPSVKCDLDPADPTDHNRQTCADHADHRDPTQAKHNLDLADHTDPTPENINVCGKDRSLRTHLGKSV